MAKHDNPQQFVEGLKKLCNQGSLHEAIRTVDNLTVDGGHSSHVSTTMFYYLLQGCIDKRDLDTGRTVHSLIRRRRYELNTFLGSHLIRMYALCGSLSEANDVFSKLSNPNVFAWTAVILAHAKLGHGGNVIHLFSKLQQTSVMPGDYMYVAVLKACSSMEALHEGKLVHGHLLESGHDSNVTVCNTLISMYAICGSLYDAYKVFKRMPKASVVTWNAMIAGCAKHSCGQEALQLYRQMWQDGVVKPDNVTIVITLKVCSCFLDLNRGNELYAYITEEDLGLDINVVNALIDMCAKCGSLHDAAWLFNHVTSRDAVTWSAMIAGYVQHGHCTAALQFFKYMLKEGVKPDSVTYASILKASSSLEDRDQGKLLHAYVIAVHGEQDAIVGSTLIDMYAKRGSLEDAHRVFDRLTEHNVVTWSALIGGYAQHGYGKEALWLFLKMQQQCIVPSGTTFVSMLTACASIALLDEGKLIHSYIIISGHELDASASGALVDMYVKCGSLEDASVMFDRSPKQSIGTWTALISGYAQHNDYPSVLKSFKQMQKEGLRPNIVTFSSLLSACSHMGLVDEGCYYFNSAREEYAILQTHEHYNCMIDLLGRTGHLNEAETLLRTLPFQPDLVAWVSLLSHCRMHNDVSLARRCFNSAMLLDDKHASAYMLMSNIYVDAGMLEDASKIQQLKASLCCTKKRRVSIVDMDKDDP